jgi:tRNA1Val (adenine37-N6)-methyltransferase
MRQPFRFKEFIITDEHSIMKVGTDAVLLGAVIDTNGIKSILDIGTGSGIIALMLAQKSDASIDAMDIHEGSCADAEINFKTSPWSSRLKVIHVSFNDFAEKAEKKYDLVVTNPPFFVNSLRSPEPDKNLAKHNDSLTFDMLLDGVEKTLAVNGHFWIILPISQRKSIIHLSSIKGLRVRQEILFHPKTGKPPNRIIIEFTKEMPDHVKSRDVYLRNPDGSWHTEYILLTKNYYPDLHLLRNT